MPSSGSPAKYGDSASLRGARIESRRSARTRRGATQDANADSPNQAEQACFIPPIPPQILPSKKQRTKYATAEGLEYEVGRTGLTMASDAGRVAGAAADAAGGGDEWGARRELGRWGRECARRDGDWPPRRRVLLTRARPNPLALPVGHRLRPTREPWRATA